MDAGLIRPRVWRSASKPQMRRGPWCRAVPSSCPEPGGLDRHQRGLFSPCGPCWAGDLWGLEACLFVLAVTSAPVSYSQLARDGMGTPGLTAAQ